MPTARHGDVELFFEVFGAPSDPTLLLINGLGSQCINYDEHWCEKFAAEGYRVIRFDNRDVGLSTKFSDVRPALGAVVRALSVGQPPEVRYTLATWPATPSRCSITWRSSRATSWACRWAA